MTIRLPVCQFCASWPCLIFVGGHVHMADTVTLPHIRHSISYEKLNRTLWTTGKSSTNVGISLVVAARSTHGNIGLVREPHGWSEGINFQKLYRKAKRTKFIDRIAEVVEPRFSGSIFAGPGSQNFITLPLL